MWLKRLGIVVVLTVLASGCTGDGSEQPTGPRTSTSPGEVSPAPSAEPGVTPEQTIDPALARRNPEKPVRPPEMDGDDALAAIYTAEYFLDLYGYTVESGDTSLMKELSTEDCGFCATVMEKADERAANGSWQVGGGLERGEGTVPDDYETRETLPVLIEIRQSDALIVDSDGRQVGSFENEDFLAEVLLVMVGDSWLVETVNGEPR